jgi:hypothetical protein
MAGTHGHNDGEGPLRFLRIGANALTLVATVLALLAQVLEHFRKPKTGSNQRTNAGTALLALAVLRMLPGLIRGARSLSADLKRRSDG